MSWDDKRKIKSGAIVKFDLPPRAPASPDPSLLRYWAKTKRADPDRYHLLICHSLDVAACGWAILEQRTSLRQFLGRCLEIDDESVLRLFGFFFSLHDLGKIAQPFQQLQRKLFERLSGRQHDIDRHSSERHDRLGLVLWNEHLSKRLDGLGFVQESEGGPSAFQVLAQLVFGHHGRPVAFPKSRLIKRFTDRDLDGADHHAVALLDYFQPPSCDRTEAQVEFLSASWSLAGFMTAADWLGSNAETFGHVEKIDSVDRYWQRALSKARAAVASNALAPRPSAPLMSPVEVTGLPPDAVLTPMQDAAWTIPLGDGPRLFVLEDLTGAGKTEAAMILVHRLMAAGKAEGFYLALPTMATANAMYDRIKAMFENVFEHGSKPSLVLAHSGRDLVTAGKILAEDSPEAGPRNQPETTTAEALCNAWLSDHRKKALLAHAGVGTVDQALLAVLPVRHQSLRAFGLWRKVLVVDEAHAYDAYTGRLLSRLLELHYAMGGSSVVLSATLPESIRRQLVAAYDGRLDEASSDYPLMTCAGEEEAAIQLEIDSDPSAHRRVDVRIVTDVEVCLAHVVDSVRQGACVCWIRNTVDDALGSFRKLVATLGDSSVTLLHSRFTLGDRLRIEREILRRFGPKSGEKRVGHVVIATQVVEQSLDLDFDEMVSDLAPIDSLIQRFGRYRRHRRDTSGRRLAPHETGKDRRASSAVLVHGPDPNRVVDENWLRDPLPGTAAVYPHHGRMWLTAIELSRRGAIDLPDDLRGLVESVYGDESQPLPEVLQRSSDRAEGNERGESCHAGYVALRIDAGYAQDETRWLDDEEPPTRLCEPTVRLCLGRLVDDELSPWIDDTRNGWRLSEVRVRRSWLGNLSIQKSDSPRPGTVLLKLEHDGCSWGSNGGFTYSESEGLWK